MAGTMDGDRIVDQTYTLLNFLIKTYMGLRDKIRFIIRAKFVNYLNYDFLVS